mgnify:CR=1 FL=1
MGSEMCIRDRLYCETCRRFLPDRYVQGTCPACGSEEAKGDQCESCGRPMDQLTLVNAKCALCGDVPEVRETSHWFFDLQKVQPHLERWQENHPEWKENVKNYCRGAFQEGLRERPITRDLNWGVKVPLEEDEGKVFYVWFDAPIGYIAATVKWCREHGRSWEEYWKNSEAEIVHLIGKDIVYHHFLFWPAMLMGVNEGLQLPSMISVRGFLTLEGRKFSKSRKWYVSISEMASIFEPDYVRFYLTLISLSTIFFSI